MDATLLSLNKMLESAITSHQEERVRGLLSALKERSGHEQNLVLNHSELRSNTTYLGNKAVVFDHHGLTLLQRAAAIGCFPMVKCIISAGADPTLRTIAEGKEEDALGLASNQLIKLKTVIESI